VRSTVRTLVKRAYLQVRQALLVTGARSFRGWRTPAASSPTVFRKILFIRVDRIGDMVLSTPALRAIKQSFPEAHLTVLASRANAPLLKHDPYVDRVVVWDQARRHASPWGFLLEAARLAKDGYDAVIDPLTGYDLRTALIASLSRAPIRVGFGGYGREVFFNRVVKMDAGRHLAELVLETTRSLGAETADPIPYIHLLSAEHEWARTWMRSSGLGGCPAVALHLGAHYPSQRWPTDHYADLANRVIQDHGCDVVAIGGPGERELIRSFKMHASERVVVFESPNLRQAAALIAQAAVLVCNNSGPLHLAVALGVPTLSFMGPTEKGGWMPLGPQHVVLRQDGLPCIGCNLGTCARGDHACMRMITSSTAAAQLLPLVRAGTNNPSPLQRSLHG
jgi:lipopolysaccharide heptosyltransferase II